MDCPAVRRVSDDFVAGELPVETARAVQEHVENCPACSADLAGRRALRERVRHAFQNAPHLDGTPPFMAALRTTLENNARQSARRRRDTLTAFLALAATLVVTTGLGIALLGSDRIAAMGALARAAVGDHLNCAVKFRLTEAPISLPQAAEQYGAMYRVVETLPPDSVPTPSGEARVLERHACVYQGRRFAHIVFRYRGELVSLLVTPTDGLAAPLPASALPPLTAASRIDDTSVVGFRTAHHAVFVAGRIAKGDLTLLAGTIGGPLSAALAGT
jgi:putative zinc finger protein